MVDILHRVGIKTSSVDDVYAALATPAGVSGWWSRATEGESVVGEQLAFVFDDDRFVARVVELAPAERVAWEITEGPPEWVGTTISFDLAQDGEYVIVLFKHEGWREPVEFMHHCSTKWATFLMSLKALVETGTGAPHPHDVKIDNWS